MSKIVLIVLGAAALGAVALISSFTSKPSTVPRDRMVSSTGNTGLAARSIPGISRVKTKDDEKGESQKQSNNKQREKPKEEGTPFDIGKTITDAFSSIGEIFSPSKPKTTSETKTRKQPPPTSNVPANPGSSFNDKYDPDRTKKAMEDARRQEEVNVKHGLPRNPGTFRTVEEAKQQTLVHRTQTGASLTRSKGTSSRIGTAKERAAAGLDRAKSIRGTPLAKSVILPSIDGKGERKHLGAISRTQRTYSGILTTKVQTTPSGRTVGGARKIAGSKALFERLRQNLERRRK